MWELLGSLVSGGVSYLNASNQQSFNQQQLQQQYALAQQNMAQQREFAQQGLGWRVEDAVRHGLSPLVGAGVQPGSFQPVSANTVSPADFGPAGQDLGRAIKAMQNFDEREVADAREAKRIALEKGRLENDVLRAELASKIARENSPSQIGPPAAVPSGSLPRGYINFIEGSRSPSRSASGVALDDDKMKQKEESAPGVRKVPWLGSIDIKTDPRRASAQDLQNEYGDIMGDIMAAPNVITDSLHTMGQSEWYKRYRSFMNQDLPGYLRGVRGFRRYRGAD